MSIVYAPGSMSIPTARVFDAHLRELPSFGNSSDTAFPRWAILAADLGDVPREVQLLLAQSVGIGADIDLSSDVFDFVRSIRVWDVRYYSHRQRGHDGDCQEMSSINLGTYNLQGQFRWDRSGPSALPIWLLPSRECWSSNFLRGVGVEWRDYEGNYGHELVRY